ncbi:DUF3618 domain-containing protein [Micromonospora sp. KC721]|uniref:DUF3618 domain-containing protein n=1 Tax=Micromonospora sp. KC721 TaxID=2530380 RepID=UPI001051E904|nr:DUF3618 domain-containing protein [Micromonospora sp. KC721]TDB72728.1 DUF3618 domain-containing protein [Micromonospora sp. KC721]
MSTDPAQIRREIEATRSSLSADVDALAYKVSPGRIVDDRKQRVRSALHNAKDKVMGSASDLGHSTSHAVHSMGDHASSAATTVTDAAHRAPQVIRQRSEGNPLAAGVIAFGVGMLVSSLIPASRREQELATQVREKAAEHGGVVTQKLGAVATELGDELREPARHATEAVRATAQDAVRTVQEDGRSAAHDVKDQARQSYEQVRH